MHAADPKGLKTSAGAVHLAWAAPIAAPAQPIGQALGATPAPQQFMRPVLRPLPHLPAADKSTLQAESRMRVAVALDVICSATRKIAPGSTVLVQATRAWLSLRGRHQSTEVLGALVEQAHGPQAVARARISRALTRLASGASKPGSKNSAGASAISAVTTPQSVSLANRHVEAAGQAIVAEMVLWLASRERVEYRRG